MATIAELVIGLRVNPGEVRRDAEKAVPDAEAAGRKAGDKFTSGFASAARALKGVVATALAAVSIGAVAHGVMEVTKTASDLNETTSKSTVLFGDAAAQVQQFAAQAATSLGQSRQAALDGASTFAVYGRGAGMAGTRLVEFSTGLTRLASDMASFANTTPEEAIEAIGAALRGEMDPIEKYGVLLNETNLKQAALRMGLIKTTTAALTPQQRVLAVNAALYDQLGKRGTDTIGDFARTTASLANQQRILTANMTNLRAEVGSALLPVMTSLTSSLNSELMPALNSLWGTHGPKVVAFLQKVADRAGPALGGLVDRITAVDWAGVLDRAQAAGGKLVDAVSSVDWVGAWDQAKNIFRDLGPALAQLGQEAPPLNETIKVGGVLIGVLADNADLLGKALPYIVIGLLAFRGAQAAANAMSFLSAPLRIAELITTHRQTAAMRAHTAALSANTVAQRANTMATAAGTATENAGLLAKSRAIVLTIAAKVATLAKAVADGIGAIAAGALSAASAPITFIIIAIIVAIGLLIAGIMYLWKNNEGFRNFVIGAWNGIKAAFSAVVSWITDVAVPFVVKWFKIWWEGAKLTWEMISSFFGRIVEFVASIPGRISAGAKNMWNGVVDAAKGAVNKILSIWNSLDIGFSIGPLPDWIPGVGGKRFVIPDLFPDIPMLAAGAFVPAQPGGIVANLAEGGQGEFVAPEPKMRQWINEAVAAARAGGGRRYIAEVRAKDRMTEWLEQFVEVVVQEVLEAEAAALTGGARL